MLSMIQKQLKQQQQQQKPFCVLQNYAAVLKVKVGD